MASPSGRQPTTESAEKLDALMGLVFEHLGRRCKAGQLRAAWATLLHTFQRSILNSHRSKFTQYLLWYLCDKARAPHRTPDSKKPPLRLERVDRVTGSSLCIWRGLVKLRG